MTGEAPDAEAILNIIPEPEQMLAEPGAVVAAPATAGVREEVTTAAAHGRRLTAAPVGAPGANRPTCSPPTVDAAGLLAAGFVEPPDERVPSPSVTGGVATAEALAADSLAVKAHAMVVNGSPGSTPTRGPTFGWRGHPAP